jgi:hypothetical protein
MFKSTSAFTIDGIKPADYVLEAIVDKESNLGLTENKRLLVIKASFFYYYSQLPKDFKGTVD